MQGEVRHGRFDSLCSTLDGIQERRALTELALELDLHSIRSGDGSVEVWKGRGMGASIEILLIAPVAPSIEWTISTLVTAAGRVEHIRRRCFRG